MFSPIPVWGYHGGEGRIQKSPLRSSSAWIIFGFMLAVAIAMVLGTGGLKTAAFLWGATIVLCSIILTPILAGGRKRGLAETDATVNNLREGLSEFNEGIGGWRSLSHVRAKAWELLFLYLMHLIR